MSAQADRGGKKRRGPRFRFAGLGGLWTELAQTYRELKDRSDALRALKSAETDANVIAQMELAIDLAKARCYTLNTMLAVVDREQERVALETTREEMATLREAFDAFKRGGAPGKVVSVRPILNGHGSAGA